MFTEIGIILLLLILNTFKTRWCEFLKAGKLSQKDRKIVTFIDF